MPEIDFKSFPITRYQGSKRKILPWIHEHVKDLEFETVLDACGGSGSVSYLFKRMGKSVTYNDKLKFNYLIGKSLIQNQEVRFSEEDIDTLFEWIGTNGHDDFIENTFKGIYYWRRENRWLDGINAGIINMNHYVGQELDYKKSLAYYALFQSCIIKRPFNLFHRRNLNIRSNNVERNFGNKTTWDKKFPAYFRKFLEEANNLVFDSETECFATNESIFDIQDVDYDLVYIDPPYLNRNCTNETSNYLKCYHFLEGMANYDQWADLLDAQTINRRFKDANEQNEFQEKNILETFEILIRKFRHSKIVISYKSGGTPAISTLVKIMKQYKETVYTKSLYYKYALNKQGLESKRNREFLIIGI